MGNRCRLILTLCICACGLGGCDRSRSSPRGLSEAVDGHVRKQRSQVLPDCNELYIRYFAILYSRDQWASHPFKTVRRDIERVATSGIPVATLRTLSDEAQQVVSARVADFLQTAKHDWPELLGIAPNSSLEQMVSAFDKHYDRTAIQEVINRSQPTDIDNEYVRLCSQFGAVLGAALQERRSTMKWLYAKPYVASALVDEPSGLRVNVFDWAEKKMSEYGVDDGYAAKLNACENVLRRVSDGPASGLNR